MIHYNGKYLCCLCVKAMIDSYKTTGYAFYWLVSIIPWSNVIILIYFIFLYIYLESLIIYIICQFILSFYDAEKKKKETPIVPDEATYENMEGKGWANNYYYLLIKTDADYSWCLIGMPNI